MAGRLKNSLRSGAAAAGLLLLLCGGAELWLKSRRVPGLNTVLDSASPEIQCLLQASGAVHHELKPGTTIVRAAGHHVRAWSVRVNSWGCRGPEPDPDSNRFRILLLGDETIFGLNVEENETIASRFAKFLPESTADQLEIINGGVPGDCPALMLLRYQQRLAELKPSLVVLHVDMTDLADDGRYRGLMTQTDGRQTCSHAAVRLPSRSPAFVSQIASQSALAATLLNSLREHSSAWFPGLPRDAQANSPLAWVADSPPDLSLQIRNALEPIATLKEQLDRAGAHLLVTTSPVRWQVVETPDRSPLSQRWQVTGPTPFSSRLPFDVLKRFCEQYQLRFFSLEAAFRNAEQPARLFSEDAPVPSKLGLALYARELARYLRENPPSRW
jgi:hypothetical protein